MKRLTIWWMMAVLVLLVWIGGCGTSPNGTTSDHVLPGKVPIQIDPNVSKHHVSKPRKPVLIAIDQTLQPGFYGNSFTFQIEQIPKGYMLAEMQWISLKSRVVNSLQDAINHGGNGKFGFYISGDGQFSGFTYPNKMKDQQGQIIFIFHDDHNNKLTWKKKIILK
ncbi:hypothetical protein MH117_05595 [Paenibacillus sp. ACRRX]|uniref:hypothetical protein n=1 Tax=Paenibacillus sp. ACRRX TaxID=2918206 RepID=UPI001EF47CA4|nr:hypothetical protein [Paenibacillus sp. ACRRX]MCG7406886.1 hypothetical protein [Paenibacillus sp. ACRRX]